MKSIALTLVIALFVTGCSLESWLPGSSHPNHDPAKMAQDIQNIHQKLDIILNEMGVDPNDLNAEGKAKKEMPLMDTQNTPKKLTKAVTKNCPLEIMIDENIFEIEDEGKLSDTFLSGSKQVRIQTAETVAKKPSGFIIECAPYRGVDIDGLVQEVQDHLTIGQDPKPQFVIDKDVKIGDQPVVKIDITAKDELNQMPKNVLVALGLGTAYFIRIESNDPALAPMMTEALNSIRFAVKRDE